MGSGRGRRYGVDTRSQWSALWLVAMLCLCTAYRTDALPTRTQGSQTPGDTDPRSAADQNLDLTNVNVNETDAPPSTAKEDTADLSAERHVGLPSAEMASAAGDPNVPVQVESALSVPDPVARLDYYDDMQLPRDQDVDETPVLPEHAVNVNMDYAGIYDYRGTSDGRYRRKRTLATNIEQLLTRSSRVNRMRRSVPDYGLADSTTVTAGELAERLVALLVALQESDPSFDANDFLKLLHAPSLSEQDLEYLNYLSNMAALSDDVALRQLDVLPVEDRADRPSLEFSPRVTFRKPTGLNSPTSSRWAQLTLPELVDVARLQQQQHQQQQQQQQQHRPLEHRGRHQQTQQRTRFDESAVGQQQSEPFFLTPEFVLADDDDEDNYGANEGRRTPGSDSDNVGEVAMPPKRPQLLTSPKSGPSSSPSNDDFSRLFAIAAMMAQQRNQPADIAM